MQRRYARKVAVQPAHGIGSDVERSSWILCILFDLKLPSVGSCLPILVQICHKGERVIYFPKKLLVLHLGPCTRSMAIKVGVCVCVCDRQQAFL